MNQFLSIISVFNWNSDFWNSCRKTCLRGFWRSGTIICGNATVFCRSGSTITGALVSNCCICCWKRRCSCWLSWSSSWSRSSCGCWLSLWWSRCGLSCWRSWCCYWHSWCWYWCSCGLSCWRSWGCCWCGSCLSNLCFCTFNSCLFCLNSLLCVWFLNNRCSFCMWLSLFLLLNWFSTVTSIFLIIVALFFFFLLISLHKLLIFVYFCFFVFLFFVCFFLFFGFLWYWRSFLFINRFLKCINNLIVT